MNVIVLDGEQRSALAVTRSLGKKGIKVTVGAETMPSLSSCSRYCEDSFLYPSPDKDPDNFFKKVLESTKKGSCVVLFPMTDVTLSEILRRKEAFDKSTIIPFENHDKYVQLSDKIKLFQLARNLNVPIPKTFSSTEYSGNIIPIDALSGVGYPLVVKPCFSRIRTDNGIISASVRYAKDEEDLKTILSTDFFRNFPFLIQERIQGPGVGIFLLMKDGKVLGRFAHRRIREKPPSGGVSVLCESISPPPEALSAATEILGKLRWSGVAMVEFKMDEKENVPKLIEVNARFWGSLQLAVTSGVDFPYMLFRMAVGERVEDSGDYRIGVKSRWELGDLDHLFIRLLKKTSTLSLPTRHPSRLGVVRDFIWDTFRSSVVNEILWKNDLKPFSHEMEKYIKNIFHSQNNKINTQ
jgi:predicted ATP-grasp superfamily ATP-dependent carboligase